MDIMCQDDRSSLVKLAIELFYTAPNQIRMVVLVVLGVNAGADDMVPEVTHDAENVIVCAEERWPHVSWYHSDGR